MFELVHLQKKKNWIASYERNGGLKEEWSHIRVDTLL